MKKYLKEKLIKRVKSVGYAEACRQLHIRRETVWRWRQRDPDFCLMFDLVYTCQKAIKYMAEVERESFVKNFILGASV